MKKLHTVVIVFMLVALIVSGCGKASQGEGEEKTTIRVGTSPGPYSVLFIDAIKPILEEEGYEVTQVEFSELLQADVALADGDIDMNVDQHTAYMDNFNENKQSNLVSLTPVPTVPAGIFPGKKKSLSDVSEGDEIGIPNDPSNAARAYLLLQKAELLELDEDVPLMEVTASDIIANPYNLKIIEMDSAQIPRSLVDIDYGVIPGSIVYSANLDPATKLLSEDILKHLELVAVTTGDKKDSRWAQAVIEAYQSEAFKSYMEENNANDYWFIPEEIR